MILTCDSNNFWAYKPLILYYSTVYSPRSDPSKYTVDLGGGPLGMAPSKDKTISHGLDAAGGIVAFSVVFLWCPPNPRPHYVQRGL
jgi:hypothetical protein